MKSTIRVDFAGGNGKDQGFEPVIRVVLEDSEDTRDKLLKEFFQALGGESSWLSVDVHNVEREHAKLYTLRPIRPSELKILKEEVGTRFDIFNPVGFQVLNQDGSISKT